MHASLIKMFKEFKSGIENLVSQTVFKLWIKTVKKMFDQLLKNRLAY